MSQGENSSPVETGKVLGGIYGSLIVFFAILFFLANFFVLLPSYAALRAFQFTCLVGGFIVLLGAEIGRVLFKSGVTIVGFLGFLALNLAMVVMGLALFADMVIPTLTDAIMYVVILLLASGVWYLIIIILTLREWRQSR